ncbi:MAG: hypothetical protein ACFFCM_22180 [Promethearchaeota archaeon]
MNKELPKILCTSVIRYSQKGESHGKVYFVDLNSDNFREVIDWNDPLINWEGIGCNRGLRGIAFYNEKIYIAATDKIIVFNKDFQILEFIKNKYLQYCHEIYIFNNILYITSTFYDSILQYNLISKSFKKGFYLKSGTILRFLVNLDKRIDNKITNKPVKKLLRLLLNFIILIRKNKKPHLITFNPNSNDGPKLIDIYHINNVFKKKEKLYLSGANTMFSYFIKNDKLYCFSKGNLGTHNLRPYNNGILLNDTNYELVTYKDRYGKIVESFQIIAYDKKELLNAHLPYNYAKQSFGRGLCITSDGLIIGGSSPATISIYQFGQKKAIKTIKLSNDMKNAIHGLEIWPF